MALQKLLLALLLMLLYSSSSLAQAPDNDLSENATPLISGESILGNTCEATEDETLCVENSAYGVWYVFNSGDCDALSFHLENLTGVNIAMSVFEEDVFGSLQEVACCPFVTTICEGSLSELIVILPNTNYYIHPFVDDTNNCGEFLLTVACDFLGCTDATACNYDPEATLDDSSCEYGNEAHDFFENALSLNGVSDGWCGTYNHCFSTDSPEWPGKIDMWYQFNSPGEEFSVSVTSESVDLIIGLFNANADLITEMDANFTIGTETIPVPDSTEDSYVIGIASLNPQGMVEICFAVSSIEGDLDGDGIVSIDDLLILLGDLGCEEDCVGDLDGDGQVTIWDLLILLGLIE